MKPWQLIAACVAGVALAFVVGRGCRCAEATRSGSTLGALLELARLAPRTAADTAALVEYKRPFLETSRTIPEVKIPVCTVPGKTKTVRVPTPGNFVVEYDRGAITTRRWLPGKDTMAIGFQNCWRSKWTVVTDSGTARYDTRLIPFDFALFLDASGQVGVPRLDSLDGCAWAGLAVQMARGFEVKLGPCWSWRSGPGAKLAAEWRLRL